MILQKRYLLILTYLFSSIFSSLFGASNSITLTPSYLIINNWETGYQVQVNVANPSTSPTTSWKASFKLENSQETITNFWNANITQNAGLINATNPSWIGGEVIPANGSTSFGFIVSTDIDKSNRTLQNLQATGTVGTVIPNPPSAPTLNAISVASGANNYTVSWSVVTGATSYTLQQSTTSSFTSPTTIYQGTATTKAISGQANGTYYYRVSASNSAGTSAYSNVQTATVNKPSTTLAAPVLNAISVASGANNYTVLWSAVTGATSYTLQQSTTSSFASPTTVYQGTATSKAISNQANGTYYYRVNASNSAGTSAYSNVQTATVNKPSTTLAAPVLNAISVASGANNYTVSWNVVTGATSYTLQQSTTSSFASPITVYQGTAISKAISGQAKGTYYYRVNASNSTSTSAYSNTQSAIVNTSTTPGKAIVEGYWESWATDPINSIVNMKTDIIDVSFVTFQRTGTNTFSVIGLDVSSDTLTQFVNLAHAAGKKVKISVGGATYGMSNLLQSNADAQGLANAIAQYVNQYSLDGIDYDIEDYPAANLQIALLQYTRQQLGANKIISYTPKAPASTTNPYAQVIASGYQYLDYISIMAYDTYQGYNYQADVQALIKMGVPASKIVVGLMPGYDDLGVQTSLSMISTTCQYILNNGLHGIMFWSLNRDLSNATGLGASAATNTSWSILHG